MNTARPGVLHGVTHALRGFRLIVQPGVRAYVAIPLAINVLVLVLALYGIGALFDWALGRYLAGWPQWLQQLLWALFALLAGVTVFFTFSIVANLVAGPFNGLLAEAVEAHLMRPGQPLELAWRRVLLEAARGVWAELRKLCYIGLRALPLLILSVIPMLNLLAPPVWLLFGAWMLALEYLDCPLSNHGRVFPAALAEMRANRRLSLGFGGCMTVLTLIPGLNFLAMPVGVAGATSLYCAHLAPAGHANQR